MSDSSNQVKNRTLSKSEVAAISTRYIKAADKWHRMLEGMASNLERYENGIIYLNIKNTGEKRASNLETAIDFASSWVKWNEELKDAKGFVVAFYTSHSTGFMVNVAGADKKDVIKSLARQLIDSDKQKSELVDIFSGLFVQRN